MALGEEHPEIRDDNSPLGHIQVRPLQIEALDAFLFGRIVDEVVPWVVRVSMNMLDGQKITRKNTFQTLKDAT